MYESTGHDFVDVQRVEILIDGQWRQINSEFGCCVVRQNGQMDFYVGRGMPSIAMRFPKRPVAMRVLGTDGTVIFDGDRLGATSRPSLAAARS